MTPSITLPKGFTTAGGTCGIKQSGKSDLALIVSDVPAKIAAVFTSNQFCSDVVTLGRQVVKNGKARAIICNSGNANTANGPQGMKDARAMCEQTAKQIGCDAIDVLPSSTGIIGEPLPIDKILAGIDQLSAKLDRGPEADTLTAEAIMTTDLVSKATSRRFKLGNKFVHVGGIAKGSGMIAPNMATMLSFLTTDANISTPLLKQALKAAVNADASFNRISVDQHMSCSDTVAILANGQAGNSLVKIKDKDYVRFVKALTEICQELAYAIAKDGEGATRVIRVAVTKAKSDKDAYAIAKEVANSPLVKTAVHGGDPNWGRIVTAAGYANGKVDPDKLTLKVGGISIFKNGLPTRADLKKLEAKMQEDEVVFTLVINQGDASCEFLTCDLSREYITINADYHT